VKIPKGVQQDAHAVILIGGLALGKMRPDLARFIVANEHGVKILVVVGEVCGSGFRRGRAVAGSALAEIGDRQFRFARMMFQEIFQLGRAMHAWNLRQQNLRRTGRRRHGSLCGNTRPGGTNDNNPQERIPDNRAHLGSLYITYIIPSY
jgi:hypothetical protein